ncbi:peptidoglycan-binding protein [Streptomyces sp. NPDC048430]|uniref:peptidoglycan-binding protein n=1 Tax=Streptomyces sp. NPDC048430 TaxID=3155388 RepID=UPI0034392635
MERGIGDPAATALQKNLLSCYGYKPAADGVYGELTESALISVRKKAGVAAECDYGTAQRAATPSPPAAARPGSPRHLQRIFTTRTQVARRPR